MKIRIPFILVFLAITCFYVVNALYEALNSASFLVDDGTAGFVEK